MKRFISLIILFVAFYGLALPDGSKFVVVIDPGHGGKDGGAVRGTYREKDINLGVAKVLGELIEKNYKDVQVVYTRKTDVFVDLDRRAKIANKAKANLFISIHTNSTAAKTANVSGADTYILGLSRSAESLEVAKRENSVILLEDDYRTKYEGFDPNSPESYIIFEFMTNKYMEQSLQFAEFVQGDFKNVAKRTDRGVRQAGFLVLRKTSMPSVLIELGFINNPVEAKYLSTQAGQKAMGTAIYSGFKKYKRDFDKKQGRYYAANDKIDDDVIVAVKESSQTIIVEEVKEAQTVTETAETTKQATANQIEYRVQFLVSDKVLPANSSQFKGLSPVNYYKDGKEYKYTYGSTTDVEKIARIQKEVKAKFKDAFVVKFKNGKRI